MTMLPDWRRMLGIESSAGGARKAITPPLPSSGISDATPLFSEPRVLSTAPVPHLLTCADCGTRSWRPADPRYGAPARCMRCENVELARLHCLIRTPTRARGVTRAAGASAGRKRHAQEPSGSGPQPIGDDLGGGGS